MGPIATRRRSVPSRTARLLEMLEPRVLFSNTLATDLPSGRPAPTSPPAPSASVFLSASASSAAYGTGVTFVAHVLTSIAGNTNGMKIDFIDNSSGGPILLATQTLINNAASFSWNDALVGSHQISAQIETAQPIPSAISEPQSLLISPAATAIAASSAGTTVVAQVSSVAVVCNGSISFFQGKKMLATVPVDGSGQATLSLVKLRPGKHKIVAAYNGSSDFTPSTSEVVAARVRAARVRVAAQHRRIVLPVGHHH